jgi:hypothetical protein
MAAAVKENTKRRKKVPAKKTTTIPMLPLDSPAMGTRSKKWILLALRCAQGAKEGLVSDLFILE